MTREPRPTKPGYYKDPSNGDMWHLSNRGGWSWINGVRWSHVPDGLVWDGEPNPYQPEAAEWVPHDSTSEPTA